jgi:hypothetical protein
VKWLQAIEGNFFYSPVCLKWRTVSDGELIETARRKIRWTNAVSLIQRAGDAVVTS